MNRLKILIVGNGGREHALAWKIAQSDLVKEVFVAPGNPGTALEPNTKNIAIEATDIPALVEFANAHSIDLTLVGPEAPLCAGIVDAFQAANLACFGPSKAAAQLEASKAFSKDFMQRHHIPTASYGTFTDFTAAKDYIHTQTFPLVIKASGLAAGKGVVIAQNEDEALASAQEMLSGKPFGSAGHEIVIEEFLQGEEASFIVMVDGEHVLPLASSQDHKARDNGDQGPNTGGMGAYSPAPVLTPDLEAKAMAQVILPTVKGMAQEGSPFTGFLYAGLMISPENEIKVLEFNCRLGDPETQPLMLRLKSDLVRLCQAALAKQLDQVVCDWDPRPALGVVLAAGGYPSEYKKGVPIQGLEQHTSLEQKVFQAGTAQVGKHIVTMGGRVLCAAALGSDLAAAQTHAYELVKKLYWPDMYYRTDIGYRGLRLLKPSTKE
jgi:phosphoribosylamine--glycine ligase